MASVQPFAYALVAFSLLLIIGGVSRLRSQEVFVLQSGPAIGPGLTQSAKETCMGDEIQEEIRAIMLKAIDRALEQHTIHVWDVWLKDPGDQPKRAIEGMRLGISAYLRTRKQIDKWDPPNCPP